MEKLEKLLETVLNQQEYSAETKEIIDQIKVNSRRQKRLYEGILSNTPDWAYILDPDHRFMYANDSLLKAMDKSWDEVIGKSLTGLGSDQIKQQIKEIDKVISTKEQVRGELWVKNENGEQIYDYIFVPIIKMDGKVEAVAGTSRNITKRIIAERELEHELKSMQRLQKMSTKLMLQGDTQRQLNEVLETALEIMGADKGTVQILEEDSNQLVRKAHQGYSKSWPEKYQMFDRTSDTCPTKALEKREQVIIPNIKKGNLLNDNVSHELLNEGIQAVQSTLLRSRSNEVLGILTTHWTQEYHPSERQLNLLNLLARQTSNWIEQYRANNALRDTRQRLEKTNKFLEERIEKRTKKLKDRAAKMQNLAARLTSAKQQERKRIATILHDDLQQLLVSTKMHIGLLNNNKPSTETAEKAIQMLDQAVEVSRNLTSQLRPPALHEEGFVSALEWLTSDMKERHHLEIKVDIDDEGMNQPLSDEIKVLLFECTRELLFNVVKYADVDEAAIKLHPQEDQLQVIVEDKGKGFDVEEARTHSEGFGLFSVLERLEAFGGSANIGSEPGCGTTIKLRVPLNDDIHGDKEDKTDQPREADIGQVKVLIVDDYTMIRKGITKILQKDKSLWVKGAKDGYAALDELARQSYDVILMDVVISGMNGIEATQIIRDRWPEIAVIGMSSEEDPETKKAMLDAGAIKFLPKSGDPDELIKTIIRVASNQ